MLKKTNLDEKVDKNVEFDPKVEADDFPYLWEIIQSGVTLCLFIFNMFLYCCCNGNRQMQRETTSFLELNQP